MAKIIQIVLPPLSDRSVPAPTVDLSPAGDSDLEGVAKVVAIEFLQKPFHEMGSFWPWANDAHVPLHHVQELGQLVEIGLPQENADCCPPRIVGAGPACIPFLTAALAHGTKLQHAKDPAVEADALLDEEDRTTTGGLNGECN